MSDRPELLEVTMTREVKALYFNTMRTNSDFNQRPYLDMWWFRKHFATVAHDHNIFHGDSEEGRDQYNLYFGLVRDQLSEAIKRLARNERERHPPVIPAKSLQPRPTQLPLALPARPIPESFRQWYQELKAQATTK